MNPRTLAILAFLTAAPLAALGCDGDPGGADGGADAGPGATDGGADASPEDAGPGEPDWSCLGSVPVGTPSAATVSYSIHVIEALTTLDASGVTVRACGREDDTCATVLAEGTTGADGLVTLTLPLGAGGFDGYFEVAADGFMPGIAIVASPITEGTTPEDPMTGLVFRSSEVDLLASLAGTTVDAARGQLMVAVGDCAAGTPNAGATLRTTVEDDASTLFYLDEMGAPDTAATETSGNGTAGVANVPPGRVGVRVDRGGGYVGGVDDALVRAGHVTSVLILPSNDDGSWACLGSVPPLGTPTAATATFRGRLIDAMTREPLEGASYRLCARDDTACASPIAEGVTGPTGEAVETVPLGAAGFDGFVEVTADGFVSTLAFIHPPIIEDSARPSTMAMVPTSALDTLALVAGVRVDPDRAQLVVQVQDCGGFNSTDKGGTLEADTADAMSTRYYIHDALPSTTATETGVGGLGGYFNLPAGPTGSEAPVHLDTAAGGTPSGSADIFLRAGWLHVVFIGPDPS